MRVGSLVLRRDWLAVTTSETDFSCIAEADGEVVGMGFLDIVDCMGQPGMPQGTEGVIGYIVDPHVTGRGSATSIARGLLAAAFKHLMLRRVTAGCFADNPASARVLEKASMRREQRVACTSGASVITSQQTALVERSGLVIAARTMADV